MKMTAPHWLMMAMMANTGENDYDETRNDNCDKDTVEISDFLCTTRSLRTCTEDLEGEVTIIRVLCFASCHIKNNETSNV